MYMNMTIIMTMNIYINVTNLEKLNKEENKSGLINSLLDEHYHHVSTFPAVQLKDDRVFLSEAETPEKISEGHLKEMDLRRQARGIKVCRHGVSPKFCKFAKPGKLCK